MKQYTYISIKVSKTTKDEKNEISLDKVHEKKMKSK